MQTNTNKLQIISKIFLFIQLISLIDSKLLTYTEPQAPLNITVTIKDPDNCLNVQLSSYKAINITEYSFILTFSNSCNETIVIPKDIIILVNIEVNGSLLKGNYIITKIENEKLENQIRFIAQLMGHLLKIQMTNKNEVELNNGEKQRFRFSIKERSFISATKVVFSKGCYFKTK